MKIILTYLMAFVLGIGSYAQAGNKITGTITDGSGQKPIPGVQIVALPSLKKTTTDQKGQFVLEVSDNDAAIKISCIGYLDREIKLGKSTNYAISMYANNAVLQEVVVMGTDKHNVRSW